MYGNMTGDSLKNTLIASKAGTRLYEYRQAGLADRYAGWDVCNVRYYLGVISQPLSPILRESKRFSFSTLAYLTVKPDGVLSDDL